MAELILFLIPSAIYFLVQGRRMRLGRGLAADRLGATWGSRASYLWALVLLVPLGLLGYLAIILIPAEALSTPGVSVATVTSVAAALGVVLRALGEEIFFRGLLGGVFIRRLGFAWGNLLQSAVFLVPHAALLLIDVSLWPILPVQFAAAWLLGWLRNSSGSFVPGALVHAVANLGAGLIAS
ncbi:CPBP family intramembrane glutamic endopeptidase [Labedella endophytica]|uniref:CPBP family intramembrane metalloprotease n=1 Tax=Labedella endophytica TaxID=1523160 RepID=A0A433JSD3_9MICO|nr:CPBP family intramembrane glutamic endopeptidase [Labedella endophytica]RUR01213.1 CPBP family intramembrane metalloprotease [Labedella endophytica]